VQLILSSHKQPYYEPHTRPDDARLDEGTEIVTEFWKVVLDGITPYQTAVANPKQIAEMRDDKAPSALLFKPAGQTALIRGLLMACAGDRMTLAEAVALADQIDWSTHATLWHGVIMKPSGAIDAGSEARNRAANLICWMITADRMTQEEKDAALRIYNQGFGVDVTDPASTDAIRPLPQPVVSLAEAA